jgi:type 1 fimbriae regulatory protein FimB/type 1 fimbriae regulatory protein FimE
MKSNLKLVPPDLVNRAVGPVRMTNGAYRAREHLTKSEVEQLIEAAKSNRHGYRDAAMILVAYRHGLRASELCELEWSQVDFAAATLHVNRVKNGKPATHPIRGDELRALRKLEREAAASRFVFTNERRAPFSPDGFNWLVKRAGQKAGMPFPVHAHMLRHSCSQRGSRHARHPGLPGSPQYQQYGSIYGTVAGPVQGLLARLAISPGHSSKAGSR